jgi:hypothetical protein
LNWTMDYGYEEDPFDKTCQFFLDFQDVFLHFVQNLWDLRYRHSP